MQLNHATGIFTAGQVSSTANSIAQDPQSLLYDSFDGVLAFVNAGASSGPDGGDKIVMNFVKRNESSIAYNKMSAESQNAASCKVVECYAQQHINLEMSLVRTQHTPGGDDLDYVNESVIEMQSIKRAISKDVSSLIGLKQSYIQQKGANGRCLYESLCLSEFEKQLYLQPAIVNVLTDSRVIEV